MFEQCGQEKAPIVMIRESVGGILAAKVCRPQQRLSFMSKFEHSPDEVSNSASEPLLESPAAKRAATLNSQTRGLPTYGQHRQKTMELISLAVREFSGQAERTVSVLGAGNCMDLDLKQLTSLFPNVNLLDLDRKAVESGVSEVEGLLSSQQKIVAPIDLASPLATTTASDLSDAAAITQFCQQLASPLAFIAVEAADVVVSTCVLSQILSALSHLVTEDHPQFLPLIQALRRGHLVRMLQLLKPGGRGILISDLVSSETTPELTSIDNAGLPNLLAQALATGNFFSGLHPGVMLQDLTTAPDISPSVESPVMMSPWRWQMGPRTYAVYAITFRKK
jgi:hypothetical protein